jgi:Glutamate-1-semialdehyde aminotransferase
MACDKNHFNQFFHGMLNKGIYLAPSAFEAGFVSSKHTRSDIEATIYIASKIMKRLK